MTETISRKKQLKFISRSTRGENNDIIDKSTFRYTTKKV